MDTLLSTFASVGAFAVAALASASLILKSLGGKSGYDVFAPAVGKYAGALARPGEVADTVFAFTLSSSIACFTASLILSLLFPSGNIWYAAFASSAIYFFAVAISWVADVFPLGSRLSELLHKVSFALFATYMLIDEKMLLYSSVAFSATSFLVSILSSKKHFRETLEAHASAKVRERISENIPLWKMPPHVGVPTCLDALGKKDVWVGKIVSYRNIGFVIHVVLLGVFFSLTPLIRNYLFVFPLSLSLSLLGFRRGESGASLLFLLSFLIAQ